MNIKRNIAKWSKKTGRTVRALALTLFIFFIAAIPGVEFFQPFDILYRALVDRARQMPVSGQFAVILPDDPSSDRSWRWSRDEVAEVVELARSGGARTVALSRIIHEPGNNDRLAKALSNLPAKPILGFSSRRDRLTGKEQIVSPAKDLQSIGTLAYAPPYQNLFGVPTKVFRSVSIGGKAYPSVTSAIAGIDISGPPHAYLRVDGAFDPKSVKRITVKELQQGRADLRGKILVIGSEADTVALSGFGRNPSVYSYVLGAESLARGTPTNLGEWPAMIIGILASLMIWFGSRRLAKAAIAASMGVLLVGIPLLTYFGLFGESICAVALIFVVSVMRYRSRYQRLAARRNALTDCPNLVAFRETAVQPHAAVIVCRVVNYPSLVTVIDRYESDLIGKILDRLSLSGAETIYHSDDGLFVWTLVGHNASEMSDQLDALNLLFMRPIMVEGCKMDCSVVFGVDFSDELSASGRLAKAAMAADLAISRGKKFHFVEAEDLSANQSSISLLSDLDRAIDEGEFWVAYQPKYAVMDNRLSGFEALARWTHPERGFIGPDQFIELAEAHGRIEKLSYFVLNEALSALKRLGPGTEQVTMAVNLSTRLFADPMLVGKVAELLKKHSVSGNRLVLEITETAPIKNEEQTIAVVEELRTLGVQLSIDDYGTGYSTLDYLQKMKPRELKLDRSFVIRMDENPTDRLLVKSTVDLAHSLGMVMVAEGVESQHHLDMLRSLNCDFAQGYHLGRPMPFDAARKLVQAAPLRRAA